MYKHKLTWVLKYVHLKRTVKKASNNLNEVYQRQHFTGRPIISMRHTTRLMLQLEIVQPDPSNNK